MAGGGYYDGGYAGGMAGYPGGYSGYGGYPGRDGSMVGGYLRGRALGATGAPAWTYRLTRGGGGGQLIGAGAGYRAAGGR
jgi:hypothetical protein